MAINIPIVSEFNAKGLQDAQNAFSNFRTKVGEAEGAMGKFKAGAGAALDAVKANAAQFAAAAGAAILGFAVKAIGDFQDLALAADKFANATGLAVEEASALIEVSGDLGIESETVQKAINKMNIAVAKGSDEFKALGVEVARNDQGLIDSNETFIRTVGALGDVRDSAERTRLATAVFGKSWGDMSEIIKGGAPALRAAIASVSDAKIIDPEEVKRAKELRAAQDALKDALEDVTLAVGKSLVPALVEMVKIVTPLLEMLMPMAGMLDQNAQGMEKYAIATHNNNTQFKLQVGLGKLIGGMLGLTKEKTDDAAMATELLNSEYAKNYQAAQAMRYAGLRLANAIRQLDDDTNGLIDTFDTLLDQFEREEAVEGLTSAFKEYETAVLNALGKQTPAAAAEANQAMRGLVREMASVAKQAQLTSEEQVRIVALLEKGQYDLAYQELLRQIAEVPRTIPISFVGTVTGIPVPAGGQTPSETIGRPTIPVPTTPQPIIPTLPNFNQNLLRPGFRPTPMSVNVNVQGSVVTEMDLIESVRKGLVDSQRSGKQLVYSNT